jgi:hypothetical protein
VRFDLLVDVVLDGGVRVDVIQAGLEVLGELGVVADDDAWSFDEAGFNGVV